MTYLVLSLPRSRSAWLARFLSYGEWHCGHEQLRHMRSLDDIKAWESQDCTGSAETAAAPFWRLIEAQRIVVVRRPVNEVVESLLALPGIEWNRAALHALIAYHDRKLDQIEARVPCLSVRYDELNEENCARIFEYCLPYAHDHEHWARWNAVNVQCNMQAMVRYAQAYARALEKLAKIAKHRTLTRMALREPVTEGVTFQTESFADWLAGAEHLFDEHLVQVGEAPGDWAKKNIPLMQALDSCGAMQIMTARSNGKMFGYLMSVVSPSLTSETLLSAAHTTFFASPDVPGLGLKLQRAALQALKERGVGDVAMQAGVRGSGERISAIYKRLGAADDGQLYRLQLTEN